MLSSDDGQIRGGVQPNVKYDKWKGSKTRSLTHTHKQTKYSSSVLIRTHMQIQAGHNRAAAVTHV